VKNRAINLILENDVAPRAGVDVIPKMHKARHTFGGMAGDAIPIQMLQKLYRHTHVSTTIGYQGSCVHKDADDALDAVINKMQPKKLEP
jgi:integrase/recombinase XerD